MGNYDKLIDSLDKEHEAFEDSYKSMTTTQVYNDWYIIGFYEAYYDMLSTDIAVLPQLDDDIIAWLATKEKPLAFLYNKWMSCEGSLSHDWEDMLDWITLVFAEDKYREEKEIDLVEVDSEMDVSKDKIMVAILDADYFTEHGSYPEEYSNEYAHEVYTFDTPEDFMQKWYELNEGDWYWVFDKGEIVCSGAIDPNDIEIFEEHWDKSFDGVPLDEQIKAAKSLRKESNDDRSSKKIRDENII